MVICISATVQGLDVLGVEVDRRGSVVDNLLPFAESIVAGGPVGVVNWVWLAKDGLRIELDGLLEILASIGLVACFFQLGGVLLTLCVGKLQDCGLVNLGQPIGRLDVRDGRGRETSCRLGGGFLCVPFGLFPLPPLLLTRSGAAILGLL
jgi:hypothetical protein